MDKLETIKDQQLNALKSICTAHGVQYEAMERLLQSERVKKLQKRNHYIQQTIDSEIEKNIGNENT